MHQTDPRHYLVLFQTEPKSRTCERHRAFQPWLSEPDVWLKHRALRRGWQRKAALWLALHILIHASQALGKVCPSLLQKASCSVPCPRGPWGVSSTMELGLLLWVLLGELGFEVSTSPQRLPFSIPRGLLEKGDESWHG